MLTFPDHIAQKVGFSYAETVTFDILLSAVIRKTKTRIRASI